MKITKITLKKYRNYDNLEIYFNDNINIIIGDNAQGKTNLLESIYLLGVTKSFLSSSDRSLIMFNNKASLVKGELINNNGKFNLEILISESGKIVKINNKEVKKLSNYISLLNVIIFNSDSIRVFKDSPNSRRKYFNIEISQINKKYLKLLGDYNTILRQRNEFLKVINIDKKNDIMYLDILNDKYVDLSLEIQKIRKCFIEEINNYLSKIFKYITGFEKLELKYVSNFNNLDKDMFIKKLNEEINEFKISINILEVCYHYKHLFEDKIPYDKENIIEEFYDVIQSMLQLMIFEGLTLEEIIEGQEKHFEKLESRGWQFNE